VNTGDRLLSLLQLCTLQRPHWTVEEAAREIGVSVSTAYRYFRNLCKVGLLDSFDGGKYILGPAIIEYDRLIRNTDPLIKVGQPVMRRLIARSGGAGIALLCRIYRNRVMCVHQEDNAPTGDAVSFERGRPISMFRGASSKIIFANLPSRSVRSLFSKFPTEIVEAGYGADWQAVKDNLRRLRKAGVCVTYGEVDANRVGIAAPVFGPDQNVLGSISLVIQRNEATPETIANVSALVEAAGREIHAGVLNLHVEETAAGHNPSSPQQHPARLNARSITGVASAE
jgi:DNA-binding IclR family transcriptional regulator